MVNYTPQLKDIPVNSFSVLSSNLIQLIIGSGSSGNISITSTGGIGSIGGFIFIPAPVINSVMPYSGSTGSSIIINGSGFSNDCKIKFGSIEAKVISISPNTISLIVPPVTTNQEVNVTTRNLIAKSGLNFKSTFLGTDTIFTQTSFASPIAPVMSNGYENVITADIDGDGLLDIIVPDIITKKIAICRNISIQNTILFSPKVEFDCFWLPTNIIAQDVDGDGKPDLIVGNQSYSNVFSIFRNTSVNGHISFESRLDYSTFATANMYVASGDFDGDGRFDIAVKTGNSDSVITIYKNNSLPGKILIGNPVSFYNGSVAVSKIIIADIDGDNKQDIIYDKPDLICMRNTSTLEKISFSNPILISATGNLTFLASSVADIDNDGKLDVAAIVGTTIKVYKNQSTIGNIVFADGLPIYNYTLGTGSNRNITFGDLNGDGNEEMITRNEQLFHIFKNKSINGTILFAPPINYTAAEYKGPMNLGDIDGDSKMDLIICTGPVNIFRNLLGNTSSFFCQGTASIISNIIGQSYQWQEDSGNGFINISNNTIFSGTQTNTLQIIYIPTATYGNKYRCLVDFNFSNETVIKFRNTWTGASGTAWENPLNWSCGIVPDSNTDVIINSGTVVVGSNTTIRSLTIKPNASLIVSFGVVFNVLH